ncbi:3-hydroxyisobutyrate dehydrogenase [Nitrobacteraceae bacterium AZCC 2161]
MKVGFAGLGRMGSAMAPRLLQAGVPLTVWNRSPEKAADLVAQNASVVSSPKELALAVDVVLAISKDDPAVEAVYLGQEGLLAGPVSGKLFVEMSTLQPRTVKMLAQEIAARGGRFVESPVLGTVGPARAGRLVALMGGDAADVERARSVVGHLAHKVFHIGEVGQACVMKLSVNLVLLTYLQSVSEALALGERNGLTLETILSVLAESPVSTPLLSIKKDVLLGASPPASEIAATLATVRKDLFYAVCNGSEVGVALPAGSAALAMISTACATGWDGRDIAELAAFNRELAN